MPDVPRSILISGAGSGLGRGLSLYFSHKGHRVYATDKNGAAAEETASLAGSAPGRVSAHVLDVASDAGVRDFFRTLGDEPVDVLIHNAGFQHVARLEEFPQEVWDELVGVILKGACLLTRAVLPPMRLRGFGRIIHIGSIHSLVASPYKTAYVAAKHAILGFAKTVALETADADITVNTICPSYIHTPLVDAQIKSQAAAHGISPQAVIDQIMLRPMPKRRFVTCEEVAATAEFLMSHAARNITGQAIAIDGGWTIQ